MKKIILFVAIVVVPLFALSAAYGLEAAKTKATSTKTAATKATATKTTAAKAAATKAATSKAKTKTSEMTKDQMLAELKENLASTDEIFDAVQGLKAVISKDGKVAYTYNGVALENISKEDMAKLFGRVRQALVKIRTERIQRQLEITRQVERLQNMASPRQPSRTPSAVPSVPKIPSSPPATPKRR